MADSDSIPSISVNYACDGSSKRSNELGMRVMQERAYEKRGEKYLLIKSPPASGKSRALMFIALDKLHQQRVRKALVIVPEKQIGASFADTPLSRYGYYWDWKVTPKWNLCNAPGEDGGKVKSVKSFMDGEDRALVCTHATFRFAVDKYGVELFDGCLLAVDEIHHVSTNRENVLGGMLAQLIARGKTHIVAMTGSYFRGDAEPVLSPEDEAKFETVTYTYYEQLNGYEYLKALNIGYYFYSSGDYTNEIQDVLDLSEKTIIHIPHPTSRESQKDKYSETESIYDAIGQWIETDPDTGFQLIRTNDGKLLKVADLVDDDGARRGKVSASLKMPETNSDRDHVDIIIALGMAKEGFDWIWCEHALTVGYRSSLTEVVQIIGRATRDAKGKTRARFTNLIAEPDASEDAVTNAVNDTLKAIAASLLMEQVLVPKFSFSPKDPDKPSNGDVEVDPDTGEIQIEIKGLAEPKSDAAKQICREDLSELVAAFLQDDTLLEQGLFNKEIIPQELTQVRMGKIVKDRCPELDEDDQEAVRQHAVAALAITQQVETQADGSGNSANTAFVDGVKKFVLDVRELSIDLIDSINPFGGVYSVLSKSIDEARLKQITEVIGAKKIRLSEEEARDLAIRAVRFKKERGRNPELTSGDPWERRMAEGVAALRRMEARKDNG